jgi:hypothetical protein
MAGLDEEQRDNPGGGGKREETKRRRVGNAALATHAYKHPFSTQTLITLVREYSLLREPRLEKVQ